MMKRSNAPLFWLLFGAGGMLSALLGIIFVFITGIAIPLGWLPGEKMRYALVFNFVQNWAVGGFLFIVIALFAWHAAHRIFHSLHDLGLRAGMGAKLVCYGSALVISIVTAMSVLKMHMNI